MSFFTFPAAQVGDAVTVERWNALEAAFSDFADGVTGAPKIKGKAMATDDAFLITVAASDDFAISRGLSLVLGASSTSSGSYVMAREITVVSFTGSIRFKATHKTNASTEVDLRIRKTSGGTTTTLQTWDIGNNLSQAVSIDVPVAVGDVITWEHKVSGGVGVVSSVSAFSQSGDDYLKEYTPIDET
ncbi:hypothetical protein [Dinoroseobacter sp. S375]|uniref:hypothetical protein n=1 Tax=Dinoroseobacter sp. S375 TaxID=3415136 RepID=UPI003C7AB7BA